jgi:hypothetical protein
VASSIDAQAAFTILTLFDKRGLCFLNDESRLVLFMPISNPSWVVIQVLPDTRLLVGQAEIKNLTASTDADTAAAVHASSAAAEEPTFFLQGLTSSAGSCAVCQTVESALVAQPAEVRNEQVRGSSYFPTTKARGVA